MTDEEMLKLFGMDDDSLEQQLLDIIDKLYDEMVEARTGADEFKPGTYWRYDAELGKALYFHVFATAGEYIRVRAVRLIDASTGRRVMLEPDAQLYPVDVLGAAAIPRAEFDNALNEALLVAQSLCDSERYGKEAV